MNTWGEIAWAIAKLVAMMVFAPIILLTGWSATDQQRYRNND